MKCRNSEKKLGKLYKGNVDSAGCRNSDRYICKESYVPLKQFLADEVSDTRSKESAYHFNNAAAEEKCKCAAGCSRSESEFPRIVISGHGLELVKYHMYLLCGILFRRIRKVVCKVLNLGKPVGVDPRIAERDSIGESFTSVNAGVLY